MRLTPFIVIALFTSQCGVEAGNVGKGRSGQVKVLFAQESSSGSESLSVSVASLGLIDSSDSEAATISSAVDSVDLYNSSSSDGVLVADATSVPSGSYAKIAIRLKGDKAVRYRDESGKDHDVDLEDDIKEALYITQSIEVKEGEVTTIVVSLDPYHSLSRADTNSRYKFSPRGEISRHESQLSYKGVTKVSGAKWACIYAYGLSSSMGPMGPDGFDDDHGRGGRGERGPSMGLMDGGRKGREVEGRPSFGNKAELVKDEDSSCSKAFAKTFVKDGRFEFRYLDRGAYAVRIFSSDGSYTDLSDDIILSDDE